MVDHPAAADAVTHLLLVVADDNFRRTLRRILTRSGYAVDAAVSGEEALRLLTAATYAAVITEVHLPGPTCGVTIMRHAQAAGRDTPVIFLSDPDSPPRVRAAIASGVAVACPHLPLDLERLRQIVASQCRREV